jgi:hypothetical protein
MNSTIKNSLFEQSKKATLLMSKIDMVDLNLDKYKKGTKKKYQLKSSNKKNEKNIWRKKIKRRSL